MVKGDVNVAGIAGSMAIEYDFDPEDDLVEVGDRSLDVRYQTKAVVLSCINLGEVTGKRMTQGELSAGWTWGKFPTVRTTVLSAAQMAAM